MTPSEADAAAGGITDSSKRKKDANEKILTKRQRRNLKNDKHALPQMPKIQNSDQRSKAYVRAAGLNDDTNRPSSDTSLLDHQDNNFGKKLGSADSRIRHKTVLQLKAYLKARSDLGGPGISELELLKLWKCLWHTLYMADRVPVQDELSKHITSLLWSVAGTEEEDEYAAAVYMETCCAEELEMQDGADGSDGEDDDDSEDEEVTMEEVENTLLEKDDDAIDEEKDASSSEIDDEEEQAALMLEESDDDVDGPELGHCRGAHLAALFVRTFFRTVLREWTNMDKYRIDKFYTCIRYMMNNVYQYMAKRYWNIGVIRLFNDAIYEEALSQTPNGVRYHLIDLCLEELCKVHANDAPMPLTEATFLDVMEPFFAMAQTGGGDLTVHARVVENVLEKFLLKYSVFGSIAEGGGTEDNEENKPLIFDQVHVGTVAQFIFEIASNEDTKGSFRKNLYDTVKKYRKRIKEAGEDHDVQIEFVCNDEECQDEECEARECHDDQVAEEEESDRLHEDHEDNDASSDDEEPPKKDVKRTSKASKAEKKIVVEEEPPKEKKEKSKKKRKHPEPLEEEVVTISVAEQKAAKNALLDKGREKPDGAQDAKGKSKKQRKQEAAEEKKRVKFLEFNTARSWKTSMKGLRMIENPIPETTPERSILLNKGKASKKTRVKKVGRKKAKDYF